MVAIKAFNRLRLARLLYTAIEGAGIEVIAARVRLASRAAARDRLKNAGVILANIGRTRVPIVAVIVRRAAGRLEGVFARGFHATNQRGATGGWAVRVRLTTPIHREGSARSIVLAKPNDAGVR